jgi:hypothetical protein
MCSYTAVIALLCLNELVVLCLLVMQYGRLELQREKTKLLQEVLR